VRAREVDAGVRLEDELLLLAVDADGEASAVALARLPGEPLPRTLKATRPELEVSTSGRESASFRTVFQSATATPRP
jgi:hypothetical protein